MFKVMLSLVKNLYLTSISIKSLLSNQKHSKIVYLLSFPDTSEIILDSLINRYGDKIVICYTKNSKELAVNYKQRGCKIYLIDSFIALLIKVVPLVKGSDVVLCDNYFAFLGGINFRSATKVVQLWHAGGAIKKFGLEAKYVQKSTRIDKKRFSKVYEKYTHYVVGSKKMKDIFSKSYNVQINQLPFGYFPSDRYFDSRWVLESKRIFKRKIGNKKSILYVPTYRENTSTCHIDFSELRAYLKEDWQILVKLHPHDLKNNRIIINDPNIITDFRGLSLQELLPSIDCLITDYSSVPFEYSLANPNGKILFFCYDLELYSDLVGIQEDYLDWLPGKLIKTNEDLIKNIVSDEKKDFKNFNNIWNEYNQGDALAKLMDWMDENNV